ncbi:MAG: class I SAM-dependent methyltransferase [Thermoplasmata archaeon]
MTTPSDPTSPSDRRERQRAFWHRTYAEDPAFFGDDESDFARFCGPILRSEARMVEIVELGCGYGRDTRFLASLGFHVRGVDLTRGGIGPREAGDASWAIVEADGLSFLRRQQPGSLDAIYSNLLLNMDFTEEEHRAWFSAIRAALRQGGLHLYSVRSTSDPWYGRGRPMGPDTFDPSPHGITMHFFSRDYADRLARDGFTAVTRVERDEGAGEFPVVLWYIVDRRDGPGP